MIADRRIIINADDIGMHPTIDAAALLLAEYGAVTSASVISIARPDRFSINAFKELKTDLGLHLDFTSNMANACYKTSRDISAMIISTYFRRTDIESLRSIIRDQFDRFCDVVGDEPHFVDGHEHVHQLPMVRTALIDVLKERNLIQKIYFRNPISRRWRGSKAALIGMLGALVMEKQLSALGCICNTDFFGVYDFRKEVKLEDLWHQWLSSLTGDGALAMCHPAAGTYKTIGDTQALSFRLAELKFLSSSQFKDLLAQYAIKPTSWKKALASRINTSYSALSNN